MVETEELWEIPLVDYYTMETDDGDMPTRQANGLLLSTINCRADEGRLTAALTIYSTELHAGLVMPLSPETIIQLSAALLALGKAEGKLQ